MIKIGTNLCCCSSPNSATSDRARTFDSENRRRRKMHFGLQLCFLDASGGWSRNTGCWDCASVCLCLILVADSPAEALRNSV